MADWKERRNRGTSIGTILSTVEHSASMSAGGREALYCRCTAERQTAPGGTAGDYGRRNQGLFGEPQDVAQMFLDTLDPVRVERYRRRKKWFIRLLIGVLTVALCGALYAAYYFLTTPQCVYTEEFYVSEPYEDPTAVNPYKNKGD